MKSGIFYEFKSGRFAILAPESFPTAIELSHSRCIRKGIFHRSLSFENSNSGSPSQFRLTSEILRLKKHNDITIYKTIVEYYHRLLIIGYWFIDLRKSSSENSTNKIATWMISSWITLLTNIIPTSVSYFIYNIDKV